MVKSKHLIGNKKFYDIFAKRFKNIDILKFDKAAQYEFDKVIAQLDLTGKKKIIELGCGVGKYSLSLAKLGHDVIAVDISQSCLNVLNHQAKLHKIKNIKTIKNDFSSIVFRNKFDIGICISTYQAVSDNEEGRIKILSNFIASLKSGGTLLLVEPNPLNPLFYFFYLLYPGVQREFIKTFLTSSPMRLQRVLTNLGMENININYVGFLPLRFIKRSSFIIKINEFVNKVPILNMTSAFSYITAIKE